MKNNLLVKYSEILIPLQSYDEAERFVQYKIIQNAPVNEFSSTKTDFLADFNPNKELIDIDIRMEHEIIKNNSQVRKEINLKKKESKTLINCVLYRLFDTSYRPVPRMKYAYLKIKE